MRLRHKEHAHAIAENGDEGNFNGNYNSFEDNENAQALACEEDQKLT
jgi:hypothetical protein